MPFDRITFLGFFLTFLHACALTGVLGKLFLSRLVSVYPWFTLYLILDLAALVTRYLVHSQETLVWEVAETVLVAVAVAVLWELVRVGFEGYAALGKYIRKASWYLIAVAVAVAFLNWGLDPDLPEGRSPLLHESLAMLRAAHSGLLAYVLLVIGFMAWFPVRMRRNVALLLVGFVGFFLGEWVGMLANNLALSGGELIEIFMLSVQTVCAVAWTMLLNRDGELTETITGHRWNRAKMAQLSEQLDAINASLVRMGQ